MKNSIKIKSVLCVAIAAFTIQINAQNKDRTSRNNKDSKNRTSIRDNNRGNSQNRVSRSVTKSDIRYKTAKRRVNSYRNTPRNSVAIRHNNRTYHYDNNRFYRNYNGRFISVAPRPGLRINRLPVGFRTVRFGNRNFFNFGGIFYINVNNQYEVVRPEIGTIVYELPQDAEKVFINGGVFYEFNDIVYERIQHNGARAYEVVSFVNY